MGFRRMNTCKGEGLKRVTKASPTKTAFLTLPVKNDKKNDS